MSNLSEEQMQKLIYKHRHEVIELFEELNALFEKRNEKKKELEQIRNEVLAVTEKIKKSVSSLDSYETLKKKEESNSVRVL